MVRRAIKHPRPPPYPRRGIVFTVSGCALADGHERLPLNLPFRKGKGENPRWDYLSGGAAAHVSASFELSAFRAQYKPAMQNLSLNPES